MKKLLWVFLAATSFGQVSLVGTVGGISGYQLPYAEGSVEAKHRFHHFLIGGDVRLASGRKADTGDGFHFGTRGIAAYSYKSFDFGGGYVYAKQWTSLYEKSGSRPIAYLGWHDAEQEVEGVWIFSGNDKRNGDHGVEVRWTLLLKKHWGLRVAGEVFRAHQTDQPDAKLSVGGASAGVLYRF
jgi:hypothetical protein